jgi:hypothetical protein
MKERAIVSFALVLMGGALLAQAPEAQGEQEWIKQIAGEWSYEAEVPLEAGKPPMKLQGTENVRIVGAWVIAEHNTAMNDQVVTGILTFGFDGEKKKYVGTWIDSMSSHLLHYEGIADPAARTLTLLTEGPDPTTGKRCKFKEILEVKGKDSKVFTTFVQGEDGKCYLMMLL